MENQSEGLFDKSADFLHDYPIVAMFAISLAVIGGYAAFDRIRGIFGAFVSGLSGNDGGKYG